MLSILKDTKSDSVKEFRWIFEETSKLGVNLHGEDFELRKPRNNQRQRHRSNVRATTAEDYYRITLYNEFLSDVVTELQDRFTDNPSYGTYSLAPDVVWIAAPDVIPSPLPLQ